MKGDKTRIWRGGLAEIMGAKPPPTSAVDDKSGPASGRTLVGHALDLSVLEARPRSANLSSTRVVPIEDLLREAAPPKPEPPLNYTFLSRRLRFQLSKREQSAGAGPRKRRLGVAELRRGLMGVLGAFTVGAWLWGQHPAGPAAHAQRATAPQPPQSAQAQARVRREQAKEQPKAQALPIASASAPALPRQRQAVDALASGDVVAARRIYAELASTVEGPSVYAEATRILDARLKTSGL